jgi:hypothetical protein
MDWSYAKSLIGTEYVWWKEGMKMGDAPPFYAKDAPPPPTEEIRKGGLCCTGLINLLRRRAGLPVPGVKEGDEYPGGIPVWHAYLESKKALFPLATNTPLTPGMLLLRAYTDEEDQGHVAIVAEGGGLLHCYPDHLEMEGRGRHGPGVTLDAEIHDINYYKFCVKECDWMSE